MTSMLALETLKQVSFAVRLIQVTALGTGLRGVCRIDLLATATCRRRLELKPFFERRTMPITHTTRYFFALRFPAKIELFADDNLRRSIDLIRDRYFRATFQFPQFLMA